MTPGQLDGGEERKLEFRFRSHSGVLDGRAYLLSVLIRSFTTQCPYCIEIHAKEARKAGATDAHLSEAAMVAAALRTGGTVTHASHQETEAETA